MLQSSLLVHRMLGRGVQRLPDKVGQSKTNLSSCWSDVRPPGSTTKLQPLTDIDFLILENEAS